ncbi:MAG: PAS domain-containing protein [Gemmatimonadota bacterium]|nr:PAS domain-containing protein [Gemmatimonadota bacterium]
MSADTTDVGRGSVNVEAPSPLLREAVLRQVADGVILTDPDGRIVFVNDAARELHGVAELGVPVGDYTKSYHLLTMEGDPYPPEELPLARAVLRNETVVDAQWRIRRPDGTEVIAQGNASPIVDEDGSKLGAVLTIRDITEQLRARHLVEEQATELEQQAAELEQQAAELEQQVEEAQALAEELEATNEELQFAIATTEAAQTQAESERRRVAAVLESITDASFAVDREWRATYVNAAFEQIVGRRREELLGRLWWEEFPDVVGTRFYDEYHRAMRERVMVSLEEYYLPWDRWYEVRAYPTDDGGLAVYFRDITESKRAEEERE